MCLNAAQRHWRVHRKSFPCSFPRRHTIERGAVIRSKFFVVLSGPPEMGKTSIGWWLAMSQIANGWQVVECNTPADVFESTNQREAGFLTADDAVGRTEFNVDRGALWETDLSRFCNGSIKTTCSSGRPGRILERAIREMDLQGKAASFPEPSEVLVQADKLSTKEKALILSVIATLQRSAFPTLRRQS